MSGIGLMHKTFEIERPSELSCFGAYIVAASQRRAVEMLAAKWQEMIDRDCLPLSWLVRIEWTVSRAGLFVFNGRRRQYVAKLHVGCVAAVIGKVRKGRRDGADG